MLRVVVCSNFGAVGRRRSSGRAIRSPNISCAAPYPTVQDVTKKTTWLTALDALKAYLPAMTALCIFLERVELWFKIMQSRKFPTISLVAMAIDDIKLCAVQSISAAKAAGVVGKPVAKILDTYLGYFEAEFDPWIGDHLLLASLCDVRTAHGWSGRPRTPAQVADLLNKLGKLHATPAVLAVPEAAAPAAEAAFMSMLGGGGVGGSVSVPKSVWQKESDTWLSLILKVSPAEALKLNPLTWLCDNEVCACVFVLPMPLPDSAIPRSFHTTSHSTPPVLSTSRP